MEGVIGIKPEIKKLTFTHRGKMDVYLADGRAIIVPLGWFPSIKKLSAEQRKHWYVMPDGLFSFDACQEVFHIEQILGKEADYQYLKPKVATTFS